MKGYCLLWLKRVGTNGIFENPLHLEQEMDGSASWSRQFLAVWLLAGYLASPNLSLFICKVGIFALLPTLMRKWI